MSFMNSSHRIGRTVIASAAIITAGFTASSALTAANTVPATLAGEGAGTISGFVVSDVNYTTTDNTITAVDFNLDDSASTVRIKLDSVNGVWSTCIPGILPIVDDIVCDTSGTEILIEDADELRVVALG